MSTFGLFLLAVGAIALAAVLVGAGVAWVRSLPPPPVPATPAAPAGGPAAAPTTLNQTPQPIAPQGVTVVFGVVFSAFMILLGAAVMLLVASFLFPDAMNYGGFATSVAKFAAWASGIFFALVVFYAGQQQETPLGFVGVPLWFGGRSPVEFLLPEGKTWMPPYISGKQDVDMRGRPLVENSRNPEEEKIDVPVLALVKAPADPGATTGRRTRNPSFYAAAKIRVAVRIKTFDPYLYLSFDQVEELIYTYIEATVRQFAVGQDINKLPELKDEMTRDLQTKLDSLVAEMGVDFIKLIVTDVEIPKSITAAAEKLNVEIIERIGENYQSQSLAQAVKILREQLPELNDEQLRNMVMAQAKLATMTIQSFEGKTAGPIPVITPVPATPTGGH